jgi:hypothetical protein
MRPYAEKLTELLQNLSATLEGDAGGEFTQVNEKKYCCSHPIDGLLIQMYKESKKAC